MKPEDWDMERVSLVRIKRVYVTSADTGRERSYDAIKVVLCDLHLSCNLGESESSDREIKLAKRLADSHQAWFDYDEHNAERVRRVLGIKA